MRLLFDGKQDGCLYPRGQVELGQDVTHMLFYGVIG